MKSNQPTLTETEREVLRLRANRLSLEEASQILGITREKVRQIEAKAAQKIGSAMPFEAEFALNVGTSDGDNYSFSLRPGEHVLVNGTTGVGKTILFKRMMSELISRYSEYVESIVVYDSKGCEYRSFDQPIKRLVFRGEKSKEAFLQHVDGFLNCQENEPSRKTTFFFIDEAYLLSYRHRDRRALKRLFKTKRNCVVILSSQVNCTLTPFLRQAKSYVQFRPRADQVPFGCAESEPIDPFSLETGECLIQGGDMPKIKVKCTQ